MSAHAAMVTLNLLRILIPIGVVALLTLFK